MTIRPHSPMVDALVNLLGGWEPAARTIIERIPDEEIERASDVAYRLYSIIEQEKHKRDREGEG